MAIFKKLNIGDTVATSGTRCFKKLTTEQPIPKLAAPTISIYGDFILITNNNYVEINTYDLYVDGAFYKTVKRTIIKAINLCNLDMELGTHNIYIVAVKSGYKNSNMSNTVKYVREEHTIPAGTYVFNEVLPYIGVEDGGLVTHYGMGSKADTTLFTANGTAYNDLDIAAAVGGDCYMHYSYLYDKNGSTYTKYSDMAYSYGLADYADGWQNENLRTINLLQDKITKSRTLYDWWITNTTKQ